MSCLKPEFEIENKRRQIAVEIELVLLNAILQLLENVNSKDSALFGKQNDPDYIPF